MGKPDGRLVQLMPSGEVRIVPCSPTATHWAVGLPPWATLQRLFVTSEVRESHCSWARVDAVVRATRVNVTRARRCFMRNEG